MHQYIASSPTPQQQAQLRHFRRASLQQYHRRSSSTRTSSSRLSRGRSLRLHDDFESEDRPILDSERSVSYGAVDPSMLRRALTLELDRTAALAITSASFDTGHVEGGVVVVERKERISGLVE